MTLHDAITFLTEAHPWLLWLILFVSAFTEYVFPPFPGDMVTLAGAVLVTAFGVPAPMVLLAVLAGSLLGSAADYGLGVLLARRSWPGAERWRLVRRAREGAEAAARAFARHGEVLIVVNRFLPGVRAFLFVAAGMAGMRFARVMIYATLSAVAWNILLLSVGMAVGSRWQDLESLVRTYQAGVWAILAGVAMVLGLRFWRRRHPGRRPDPLSGPRPSGQGLDDGHDHPSE